jgi:hypothetical protein
MSESIAFIAPAWVWILSMLGLLSFGVLMGALLWHVLKVSTALAEYEDKAAAREDVERELGALHVRVARLERPEPYPVRYDPPATALDSKPPTQVLRAEGDTLPPGPWVTHVAP